MAIVSSLWKDILAKSIEEFKAYVLSNPSTDILLNGCYGGFYITDEVKVSTKTPQTYDQYYGVRDSAAKGDLAHRTNLNLNLINAVVGYGLARAGDNETTKLYIDQVLTILVPYCSLYEYDGKESVCTKHSYDRFKLDVVRTLFSTNRGEQVQSMLEWLDSTILHTKRSPVTGYYKATKITIE